MRQSLLLLPLLAFQPAAANVSDAAYCANARGLPNGPYRCFNSLEGAEEWIRQDDATRDGWSLLQSLPARAGGHPTAWDLRYAVPNSVATAQPLPGTQKAGKSLSTPQYGALGIFGGSPWIACGGTGFTQGCPSEGALAPAIQPWYLATYGETIGSTYWGEHASVPTGIEDITAEGGDPKLSFRASQKRLYTLFHGPNSAGNSRQGHPALAIHRIDSTNRRLSVAVRPGSLALPGNSPAMRSHGSPRRFLRAMVQLRQ